MFQFRAAAFLAMWGVFEAASSCHARQDWPVPYYDASSEGSIVGDKPDRLYVYSIRDDAVFLKRAESEADRVALPVAYTPPEGETTATLYQCGYAGREYPKAPIEFVILDERKRAIRGVTVTARYITSNAPHFNYAERATTTTQEGLALVNYEPDMHLFAVRICGPKGGIGFVSLPASPAELKLYVCPMVPGRYEIVLDRNRLGCGAP